MMACLLTSVAVFARVALPPIFGDHAILQKSPSTGVWGEGEPGERVELRLGDSSAGAVTGADGWWHAKIDLSKSGEGPFELRAKGADNEVVSRDVLVGEVWFCSGQSNMELPFHTTLFGTVFGAEDLWKRAAGRPIRVFHKSRDWSTDRSMSHQAGRWNLPVPEDLTNVTAVGFSFIERVQAEIGGPVALVDISIGGSRTMQWTSHEKIADAPTWHGCWTNQVEQLSREAFASRWRRKHKAYSKDFDYRELIAGAKWRKGSLPNEVKRGVTYYRASLPVPEGFTTTDVVSTTRFFLGGVTTTRCALTWCRKEAGWIDVESMLKEDCPVRLGIWKDDFMRTVENGRVEVLLRAEAILPGARIAYTGARIEKQDGPERIELPQDGWDVYEETSYPPLSEGTELPKPYSVPFFKVGHFYNSMVWPFKDLTFRGAIWYQGCEDTKFADNVHEYSVWFNAMVEDWRATFANGEFPFYWCQLAGYGEQPRTPGERNKPAEVREAQRRSRRLIRNGEMAVIYETGESEIHGRNKIPAGRRLARIALARDYGKSGIVYRSADYVSKSVANGIVTLKFETYGSPLRAEPVVKAFSRNKNRPPIPVVLRSPGSQLEGFAVLDSAGAWHWAEAEIAGPDTVTVRAKGVLDPREVRYNWGGLGAGNLWNEGGLPVAPFTTED